MLARSSRWAHTEPPRSTGTSSARAQPRQAKRLLSLSPLLALRA